MRKSLLLKLVLGLLLFLGLGIGIIYGFSYYKYFTFKNEVLSLAKGLGWNKDSQVAFYEYSVKGGGCIDCASGYKAVLLIFRANVTQDEIDSIIKQYQYKTILRSPFKVNTGVFDNIAQSAKNVSSNPQIQDLNISNGEVLRYVLSGPNQSTSDSVIMDYIKVLSTEKWRFGDKEFSGDFLVISIQN